MTTGSNIEKENVILPNSEDSGKLDGIYFRRDGSGEQSFITIQLYLNEDYDGGETTFIHFSNANGNVSCKPRTGMVLVVEKKGRKYALRTDVMYRPERDDL